MSSNRSAAGVTIFEGRIYVSGGHDGLQIFNSVSLVPSRVTSSILELFVCLFVFQIQPWAGGIAQL